MTQHSSFANLLKTTSPAQWLECEKSEGRDKFFSELDVWLGTLWIRFWRGSRLCTNTFPRGEPVRVELYDLTDGERRTVKETFAIRAQQSRGALFHPEKVTLRLGLINLGWYQEVLPSFAMGTANDEKGSVALNGENGDAVAIWSIVQPMFMPLSVPFQLRSNQGTMTVAGASQAWQEFEDYLSVFGFELDDVLIPFRPYTASGKMWASWTMAQQLEARAHLWQAMKAQVTPEMAARFRAHYLRTFVQHYAAKTAKGPNTQAKVLTKKTEPLLCSLFGGDWLRALDYLGESPDQSEAIITALPQLKLYTGMDARVAEVAEQTGLPEAEVRLMVEGFWDGTSGTSPIEDRVVCLQHYWAEFDNLHEKQVPGMESLWGLVEESKSLPLAHTIFNLEDGQQIESYFSSPHYPGLYLKKLSQPLLNEIQSLWNTSMIVRFPDRLVTNLNPHYTLAQAFGVALKFWQGCALTAWFICEGPYSRTSIEAMPDYYRKQLEELTQLGTPIDDQLFIDLQMAERKLGPEEPLVRSEEKMEFGTLTVSHGSRQDGFEYLRDVVTKHRCRWAAEYLPHYLQQRWELPVREVGQTYIHQLHAKGKVPTAKVFAKSAQNITNQWFAGDMSGLTRTIGEKSLVAPVYERRMPRDMLGFALAVRRRMVNDKSLEDLRSEPTEYIQLEEALNRPPEAKEFGAGKSGYTASLFKSEPSKWAQFVAAIEAEKMNFPI